MFLHKLKFKKTQIKSNRKNIKINKKLRKKLLKGNDESINFRISIPEARLYLTKWVK